MKGRNQNNERRMAAGIMVSLLMLSVVCPAQYRATATVNLDSVEKAGFYRIVLPPSFVAQCRADLSDVRILDQFGHETPYVLKTAADDGSNARMLTIPDPRISRRDSNRHSYYRLEYDEFYRIDRLSFVITRPKLYKRSAFVNVDDPKNFGVIASIGIDPADTVVWVEHEKVRCLLVDIDNEDDIPLEISRVATAQSAICLLTLLQPQHYILVAGDPFVLTPKYDLRFFTDSLGSPALIGSGAVRKENKAMVISKPEAKPDKKAGWPAGILMWGILTLVLLLLLYVSVKLARAVDKNGKNDRQ